MGENIIQGLYKDFPYSLLTANKFVSTAKVGLHTNRRNNSI